MRKSAWVFVLVLVGTLYFLSSIPGLRVLPVLSTMNSLMMEMDLSFVRFSQWLTTRLPQVSDELRYVDAVTADFLAYARENPIIIEFFLRKLAHVFIFFIITIALFFLLHQYLRSSALAVLLAGLGATGLAILDEYRQSWVVGRVGSALDVCIDLVGIILAMGFVAFALLLTRTGRRRFYASRSGVPEAAIGNASCAEADPDTRGPSRGASPHDA